ncbi:MAG: c-type cytochrome biogenesis protein CcmI [Cocleimonas sp.]|nr:c-type cytochrome biogenesis protein CcmI [Cocleimonas sp.]
MFWIFALLLLLLALGIILPPLFKKTEVVQDDRRDQNIQIAKDQLADLEVSFGKKEMTEAEYSARRDELEQSLYTDVENTQNNKKIEYANPAKLSAGLMAVLIPAIAVGLYSLYGNPQAADPETAKIAKNVPMTKDGKPDIDAMVSGLRKKLEAEPNNPEGWYMMGRSYMALKRYKGATEAYEKLLELKPNDAKVMLFLADAMAMANQGSITGRPTELIEKALTIEPKDRTGLWLGGMAAQEQGDHSKAIQRWNTLMPLLSKSPDQQAEVRQLIAKSKKKMSPEALAKLATTTSTPLSTPPTAQPLKEEPQPPAIPTVPVQTSSPVAVVSPIANAMLVAPIPPEIPLTPETPRISSEPANTKTVTAEPTADPVKTAITIAKPSIESVPAKAVAVPAKPDSASTESIDPQSIVITISLAETLKDKAVATDTVFIYAKALAGPPMPLAAKRLQVKDLPITITLDDSMAMMPSMKLSAFPQVKIGARISKSGNAMKAQGDLYTEKQPVKKGTKQVLVIDSIIQ